MATLGLVAEDAFIATHIGGKLGSAAARTQGACEVSRRWSSSATIGK